MNTHATNLPDTVLNVECDVCNRTASVAVEFEDFVQTHDESFPVRTHVCAPCLHRIRESLLDRQAVVGGIKVDEAAVEQSRAMIHRRHIDNEYLPLCKSPVEPLSWFTLVKAEMDRVELLRLDCLLHRDGYAESRDVEWHTGYMKGLRVAMDLFLKCSTGGTV